MDERWTVALYARVSSQRQAEKMTIHSQVAALKQRIADDGLSVDETGCFLDEGYSGSTLLRPALERLRDVAYAGGLDRLYVHSPDRLARKYAYQVLLLEEFQKHGVELVFLNHDLRETSPEGDLLLQMQGMIAEYERAKIMERTRRGRRFAARQGKVSVLGHAPYGYRYVRKQFGEGEARYDIVAEEARIVEEMFRWVGLERCSLADVTRRLARCGVPSPSGKARWDRATVRGLLLNPAYTGTARYGKTRLFPRKPRLRPARGHAQTPRREKVARPTAAEEQEPIPVPALVSRELFEAVAEQLVENRRRYRQQKRGTVFLLSGLLVCGRCGSAYCGRRQRREKAPEPYVYYRCISTDKYRHGGEALCDNAGLQGKPLEAAVWSDVCALLQDPDRVRREFERRLEEPGREAADLSSWKQSIAQLKRRIGRLIDAYEQGWLEKTELQPRLRRVQQRLAETEQTLAQRQRDLSQQAELRLLVGQFAAFAQQITDGLAHADFDARRRIVQLLIKRIEIHQDTVHVVYRVQPPPFVVSPARGILQDRLKRHPSPSGFKGVRSAGR